MFTLTFIYFICLILIWWGYAGYIYYLAIYYLLRRGTSKSKSVKDYPFLSIIIPVFNEKKLITNKIQNLKQLSYPGQFESIFVDGGSQDGTVNKIEKAIKKINNFRLIKTTKGKIHQINTALSKAKGKIIVCTDVDATLSSKTIKVLASRIINDPKVGVVGAYVRPKNSFSAEKAYWQKQNQLRLIESLVYSTSIIIAPCYAFRKSLISKFPEDCVADDVYISFYAQTKNYLVKYDPKALVYETRSPQNIQEFFTHKFRKANAYITELLRFVYAFNKLNIRHKLTFFTRFLQVTILPVILLLFAAISINLFIINTPYKLAVILVTSFLAFNILMASIILNQKAFTLHTIKAKNKLLELKIFFYSNFILFFAIFTYFFYKQDSSYQKIRK